MADQLQLRGGKTAQSQSFVGAEREITIDTELLAVRLHDGSTPGGHIIASLDTIQGLLAEQSTSFSTDLSSETTDREAAIAALQAAVNQAIADRTAADAATLSSANSYTDTKVSDVLGNAPELLNQLEELAAALGDDENFAVTIQNTVATLRSDLETALAAETAARSAADTGLGDRVATLETDPITASVANAAIASSVAAEEDARILAVDAVITGYQAADAALTASVAALQDEVDDNEVSSVAADSALASRLDVLEADATTATAVAAVQADVDANELASDAAVTAEETARIAADASTLSSANSYTDSQVAAGDATVTNTLNAQVTSEATTRAAADTALSARLDVLEVDPTTASALSAAVAAVQADVDQNEADSDAAIAAEEARALAAEAAITATHAADEADHEALELNAGLAFGQLYVGDLIVA